VFLLLLFLASEGLFWLLKCWIVGIGLRHFTPIYAKIRHFTPKASGGFGGNVLMAIALGYY
jgi:hypothetical protein